MKGFTVVVGLRADGKVVPYLARPVVRFSRKICGRLYWFSVTRVDDPFYSLTEERSGTRIGRPVDTAKQARDELTKAIRRHGAKHIRKCIDGGKRWQEFAQ